MIALEYCMFKETLKELRKADGETSYNLSMKLAKGRCWIPQQRFNNLQSLEGRKQWHPHMVFLWGPELRNTGLQLCEIVHGMVYGFVDLQLTTILKIYLGFKKNPAKHRYQCSLFNKSFVTCVFSCIHMYIWYAYINKWTSELSIGTHV